MSPPPIGDMGRWLNDFGGTISGPGSVAPITPSMPTALVGQMVTAANNFVSQALSFGATLRHAPAAMMLERMRTPEGRRVLVNNAALEVRFRHSAQNDFTHLVRFLLRTANQPRETDEVPTPHRAHALYTLLQLRAALVADISRRPSGTFHRYPAQSRDAIFEIEEALRQVSIENVFGTEGQYAPRVSDPEAYRFIESVSELATTHDGARYYLRRLRLDKFLHDFLLAYQQIRRVRTGAGQPLFTEVNAHEFDPGTRGRGFLEGALAVMRADRDHHLGVMSGMTDETRTLLDHYLAVDSREDELIPLEQVQDFFWNIISVRSVQAVLHEYEVHATISAHDVVLLAQFLREGEADESNASEPVKKLYQRIRFVFERLQPLEVRPDNRDVFLRAMGELLLLGNVQASHVLLDNARVDLHSFLELARVYQVLTSPTISEPHRRRATVTPQLVAYHLMTSDRSFFEEGLRVVPEEQIGTFRHLDALSQFAHDYHDYRNRRAQGSVYAWSRDPGAYHADQLINAFENAMNIFNERILDRTDPGRHLERRFFSSDAAFEEVRNRERRNISPAEAEGVLEGVFRDPHIITWQVTRPCFVLSQPVSAPNDLDPDALQNERVGLRVRTRFHEIPTRAESIEPRYEFAQNGYERVILSYLDSDASRRNLAIDRLALPLRRGELPVREVMTIVDFLFRAAETRVPAGSLVRIQALETLLLLRSEIAHRTRSEHPMSELLQQGIGAIRERVDEGLFRLNPLEVVGRRGEFLPEIMSGEVEPFLEAMRSFAFLNPRVDAMLRSFDWVPLLEALARRVVPLVRVIRDVRSDAVSREQAVIQINRILRIVQQIVYLDEVRGLWDQMPEPARISLDRAMAFQEVDSRNRRLVRMIRRSIDVGNHEQPILEQPILESDVTAALDAEPMDPYDLRIIERFIRQEGVPQEPTRRVFLDRLLGDVEALGLHHLRAGSYVDRLVALRILSRYGNREALQSLIWNAQQDPNAFKEALDLMTPSEPGQVQYRVNPMLHYGLLMAADNVYGTLARAIHERNFQDERRVSIFESLMEERLIVRTWLDALEASDRETGDSHLLPHRLRPLEDVGEARSFLTRLSRVKTAFHERMDSAENPQRQTLATQRDQHHITDEEYISRVHANRAPLSPEDRLRLLREVASEGLTAPNGLDFLITVTMGLSTEARVHRVQRRPPVITTVPRTDFENTQRNAERNLPRSSSPAERVLEAVRRELPDPLHSEGREVRGRR